MVPVCFLEVAAFTAASLSPLGDVRDYGQASEFLAHQAVPLLWLGRIGPAVGEDVSPTDDEDTVVLELSQDRVFRHLFLPRNLDFNGTGIDCEYTQSCENDHNKQRCNKDKSLLIIYSIGEGGFLCHLSALMYVIGTVRVTPRSCELTITRIVLL